MVSHNPLLSRGPAAQQLQNHSETTLDRFKHGEISQAAALNQFEQGVALYADYLREAFLVRLHNLEGFRTPRGHRVPEQGGR